MIEGQHAEFWLARYTATHAVTPFGVFRLMTWDGLPPSAQPYPEVQLFNLFSEVIARG